MTVNITLLQPIKYFYNQTYEERSGTPVSEGYLTFLWSLTTAIFIPGGMLGSFLGGWLADKLGRLVLVIANHYFNSHLLYHKLSGRLLAWLLPISVL